MSVTPRNGGFPQQIPKIDYGWGRTYPDAENISGFYWNLNTNFLYTQTPDYQFNVFLNVPQSVAQSLSFTTTPDTLYTSINTQFPQCLLTENCVPLITESGTYLVI